MAIVNVGDSQQFDYTGGIQQFVVPKDGLYRIEAWGAGESYYGVGGGYSSGYREFKSGQILYVCCGGRGSGGVSATGGYNGGRESSSNSTYCTGGGGATHVSFVTGLLSQIGYNSFVNQRNGLIVAGGAGGSYRGASASFAGGTGGGLTGGNSGRTTGGYWCTGGSQTAGGSCTGPYVGVGTFGMGGKYAGYSAGGGGGLYGGGSGNGGGGGGSGWIDGMPEIVFKGTKYSPYMSNGANAGTGFVIITFIAKGFPSVLWNGITLDGARHDIVNKQGQVISSTEIDTITFDGKPIE